MPGVLIKAQTLQALNLEGLKLFGWLVVLRKVVPPIHFLVPAETKH